MHLTRIAYAYGERNGDSEEKSLLKAYDAFNRCDIEALTALVSEGVDWPDNEARLHGKDSVRAYWLRQWARVHTHDEPTEIEDRADGTNVVRIHQVVRALDGSKISEGTFDHVYWIENEGITRMDIQPVQPPS